jgi:hypothetical protein
VLVVAVVVDLYSRRCWARRRWTVCRKPDLLRRGPAGLAQRHDRRVGPLPTLASHYANRASRLWLQPRFRSNKNPWRICTSREGATCGGTSTKRWQRWEFESSLAEIETRQRGSYRVLRSQSPEMVRQEIWALLLTHYAIRALMYEATDPERLDPLRMSFIRTLRIVRRHVTGQAGFSP